MDYIYANLVNSLSANDLAKEILNLQETKQNKLVSGQNIKTINHNSLLGEGNLSIIEGKLQNNLTATIAVGGVEAGTVFPAGTSFESILREIFKTNISYTLYCGVCPTAPVTVDNHFEAYEIPEHFVETGFAHHFTTQIPGQEEGNYVAIAYPTVYGPLAHIYCNDLIMFDLIDNWTREMVTVGGTNFYLYYQNLPTKETDSKYTFLFN